MSVVFNLFLSLFAVAGAGFVVGWFARRISAIQEHNQTVVEAENRIAALTRKLRTSLSETAQLSEKLQESRGHINTLEKSSRHPSTHTQSGSGEVSDDLRNRDNRIAVLESQLLALEEQHKRVQRETAQVSLRKAREIEILRQQLNPGVSPLPVVADADSDFPVLSKKAAAGSAVGGSAAADLSLADPAHDGDVPRYSVKGDLPNITHDLLDEDEDVLEMTSEFNFDSSWLLTEESESEDLLPKQPTDA